MLASLTFAGLVLAVEVFYGSPPVHRQLFLGANNQGV